MSDNINSEMLNDLDEISSQDLYQIFVTNNMDIAPAPQYVTEPALDHWNKIPNFHDLDTTYNFTVDLNSEGCGKNSWIYSKKLNKVYVKLYNTMTVNISYIPQQTNLFLRAMVVYTSDADIHSAVERCHNHRIKEGENGLTEEEKAHILRCGRQNAVYVGTATGQNFGDRLAVIIPLGQSNEVQVIDEPIALTFVCQNSCTSGINRRPTAIIFTLENERKQITGKKIMNFKVCSCPKRDMEKEENLYDHTVPNKRKREFQHSMGKKLLYISTKKIKTETLSPNVSESTTSPDYDIPGCTMQISMPDKESMMHVLRCAYNEVTGQMACSPSTNERNMKFAKNIKRQMESLNRMS